MMYPFYLPEYEDNIKLECFIVKKIIQKPFT